MAPDPRTRSTIAATRPSSGSCSRPPSAPASSSTSPRRPRPLVGLITIRRGKGGRGSIIPIGQATTEALLVYLDDREQHPLADAPTCGSATAASSSAAKASAARCAAAPSGPAVQGFRPHRLRHTAAHRWLAAGGSESGLMAIAGWTRTDMLVRYTRARASERAADEARRLNLGEL